MGLTRRRAWRGLLLPRSLSGGRGGDPSRRRLKPTGLVPRGSFTQIKICSHPFLCKKNFSSGMNGPGRCTPWPQSATRPRPGVPAHLRGSTGPSFTNGLLNGKTGRKLYVRDVVACKIAAAGGYIKSEWPHRQGGFG